jgi:CcmD family protein
MQRSTTTLMTWMVAIWLAGVAGAGLEARTSARQATPQTPAAQAAGEAPLDQFVPVKSLPQQEALPAARLLMAAYGFVWAVLLAYVWTIWRRLMKVEREMHELSARIAEKAARH